MDNLPPELIVLILLSLRVKDALSLSAVSRSLRRVVTSCNRYWREKGGLMVAVGHSPQSTNQWDAFVSYCRQVTEVRLMFAVDCELLHRAEPSVGQVLVDSSPVAVHWGKGVLTTPLAGGSCLVRGSGSRESIGGIGVSYKMTCYRASADGAIQKVWSLGDTKKCVLFATNPGAPFLVVLIHASRGVKLKWIDVTSGVTLWKSELDKLPRMKHSCIKRSVSHCDKYPNHGVLCPCCGAVIIIRPQSATDRRGIAIIYVPDTVGGARQFAPHTFTCHIVASDQCIVPFHDCLVALFRSSPHVSGDVGTSPPRLCKEHELVTYCSHEFGECSLLKSIIRYDGEAKQFQHQILSVSHPPVSVKLDMVGITTSPLQLVALDTVDSDVQGYVHLQASVFDIETMECAQCITLEYVFDARIHQDLEYLNAVLLSIHLCTPYFLVLFARDCIFQHTKYLCFSLITGKCIGELELSDYGRQVVVMNRALLESLVHVNEERLYKLPLLAILHRAPQQSGTSTSNSKCMLM